MSDYLGLFLLVWSVIGFVGVRVFGHQSTIPEALLVGFFTGPLIPIIVGVGRLLEAIRPEGAP